MKPEKQRIFIAEACGWKRKGRMKVWTSPHPGGGWEHESRLPDYLNDLNAMMDAFSKLGRHWEIRQVGDGYVCRIQFGPRNKDIVTAGLATLPVMAEAFLRTVGRWEE